MRGLLKQILDSSNLPNLVTSKAVRITTYYNYGKWKGSKAGCAN